MRTMAAEGWVCFLTGLLSLACAVDHNHQWEADTYHVSAGQLFLLSCQPAFSYAEIMWSRGDSGNEKLPPGVEIRDGLLWFLPLQMTHNGSYICEKRNETRWSKRRFRVLVSRGACPDPNEEITVIKGTSESLQCKQTEVLRLNLTRKIRWMKDCRPVQLDEESIYLNAHGSLRLLTVSEEDEGKYTCLVDITVNGQNYTAARSLQLTLRNGTPEVFPEVYIISPENEVVVVQVGKQAKLQCLAYAGFSEDAEIFMYWTINGSLKDNKEINESWKFIHDRGTVYGQSNLSIAVVKHEFLNVPIVCHIYSPVEHKCGTAWLQEANHSVLYITLAFWPLSFITILLLAALFFIFKVNLILTYRKLNAYFSKQQVTDGKLYDAYVSVSPSTPLSLDGVTHFALQILPHELEQKHGYSLYIRGRDDCPGEAAHDVLSTAVRQCRRLLIILSSHSQLKNTMQFWENQNHLMYDQRVGLHDALIQNDPKVILIEVDGPVDYSRLPESLRYIKRKQGALEWNNKFAETNKLTQMYLKNKFWKNLRFHMPAVPARRQQGMA